ncbi:hypothetical protein [Allocoleopsis sp.]|uniref:hypothetical protein n=1 Tax=Allocoleopsis sp. TaxID=3088169 RepID=UPI002FD510F9
MNPIGYWAGALPGTTDANILAHIQEQFGSRLEELNRDDKASLLICLVEAAVNPQQVMTEPKFYSEQNGGEAWLLAQQLSPSNQIALSVALANQLLFGGHN